MSSKAQQANSTEAELELEDDVDWEAVARATAERDARLPRAHAAHYDAASRRIVIELRNGVTLLIPARLIQGLESASDEQLSAFTVTDSGAGLHWDALDVQMGVEGLASGRFGSEVWMEDLGARGQAGAAAMGRRGGAARTPSKSAAARQNGKKGGRPRKVAPA